MKYKPTQVYLDPDTHAKLKAEAFARGISLAALLRELADAHVSEHAPAYGAKSWDALFAATGAATPTDIAITLGDDRAATADATLRKKLGKPARKR